MSFDENVELISSYNEWVIQRKMLANDTTPEAFLKDQMKQDSTERLLTALDFIEVVQPDDNHEDALQTVANILRGQA